MLELKFAIYYRAASPSFPSQAFYAVLAQESLTRPGFLQTLPHTNSISNSAILQNNYISLLSDLCACVHVKKKNGVIKEATVLHSEQFESPRVTSNMEKSDGLVLHLISTCLLMECSPKLQECIQ